MNASKESSGNRKSLTRKNYVLHAASYLNEKYGKETVVVDLRDSYYNMREKIEPDSSNPIYIMTKWGVGYFFAQPA